MKIVLLHTVPGLASLLGGLAGLAVPDANLVHLVDESLLRDTITHGRPPEHVLRALGQYARFASEANADALLVTCSSIGEAAQRTGPAAGITVLRIDEPMCRQAVRTGRRIGVLATLATTLEPTTRLVERVAAEDGLACDVQAALCDGAFEALCDGAFEALRGGDPETHDALVVAAFHRLAAQVEVVVLAQASMARLLDDLPSELVPVPVLSSPESGIRQLRDLDC